MIDRARLTELKQEIGEEDFGEVAEIFLEEMDEMLTALCADPAAIVPAAFHGLRGSASNLGFSGFATACIDAEKRSQSGEMIDMEPLVALFRASVVAAGDELPAMAA
jgi:histidine phosphotransfer protein HptB